MSLKGERSGELDERNELHLMARIFIENRLLPADATIRVIQQSMVVI